MGFSSHDDFLNKVTVNSQFWRTDWNKLTHAVGAQTAGEWHCLFHATGNPTVGVLNGGTNKSFQSLCEESAGAIRHNGIVAPATKHIINASSFSAAATSMPSVFMLVDLLGYYPDSTITTTGDQDTQHTDTVTFSNATNLMTHAAYDIASFTRVRFTTSGTLPAELALETDYWTVRQSASTSLLATSYANAVAGTTIDLSTDGTATTTVTTYLPRYTDGAGVQIFTCMNTAGGAGTPNYRATYTAAGGATGKQVPVTLPVGKASPGIGMIQYSGTGAGKFGPFMPLAAGDRGIVKVEQIYRSATQTSGTMAWCLAKPILTLPMTTIGVAAERDLLNQLPSLPRIYDGACLTWLMYAGAATPVNSAFYGHLDFGWG